MPDSPKNDGSLSPLSSPALPPRPRIISAGLPSPGDFGVVTSPTDESLLKEIPKLALVDYQLAKHVKATIDAIYPYVFERPNTQGGVGVLGSTITEQVTGKLIKGKRHDFKAADCHNKILNTIGRIDKQLTRLNTMGDSDKKTQGLALVEKFKTYLSMQIKIFAAVLTNLSEEKKAEAKQKIKGGEIPAYSPLKDEERAMRSRYHGDPAAQKYTPNRFTQRTNETRAAGKDIGKRLKRILNGDLKPPEYSPLLKPPANPGEIAINPANVSTALFGAKPQSADNTDQPEKTLDTPIKPTVLFEI